MKYVFVLDESKCVACGACAVACMDQNDIDVAAGEYIINSLTLPSFKPTLTGLIPDRNEECVFASCITECTEDTLSVFYRFKNAPHSGKIIFTEANGELSITFIPGTGSRREFSKIISGTEI